MAGPLLLSDNLYNTIAYPSHTITADEQAVGHEIQNIADGRRSQYDYYTSVTANTERTLKVQCDTLRSVNTLFLDRGHNLTDKSIAYEHSANGSSWTTAWTFAPTGFGADVTASNYCLQSQALATTPWSVANATATNNVTSAPDGSLTATRLTPNVTGGVNHYARQSLTITANEKLAGSIYVKANGYTCLRLVVADVEAATNSFRTDLDLVTGTLSGSTGIGLGVLNGATVTAYPDGWYRILLHGAVNNSATTAWVMPLVYPNIAGVGSFYAGDGTSGVYLWGAQLERNSTTITAPRGYVRTTTLAAAGTATEDGAWGYTFTAASNLYHRIRIPAMGTGLVPVVVGAWLGTAYQPSFFYNPWSDDGATFTRPGNTTEWGWRGGGPPVVTHDGTLNLRLDSAADYTAARPFLVKQFAAGRPMWICHDQAQADRTILAMFPDGARIDPRFDSGWFPRQVQLPYVELEPKRQ